METFNRKPNDMLSSTFIKRDSWKIHFHFIPQTTNLKKWPMFNSHDWKWMPVETWFPVVSFLTLLTDMWYWHGKSVVMVTSWFLLKCDMLSSFKWICSFSINCLFNDTNGIGFYVTLSYCYEKEHSRGYLWDQII